MDMYGKRTTALAPADGDRQNLANLGPTRIGIDELGWLQRRRVEGVKGRALENAAKRVFVRQVERTSEIHEMETDNAAEIYKTSRSKLHQDAMNHHRLDTMESAIAAKDVVSAVEIKIAHNITRFAEENKAEIEKAPVGDDAREYLRDKLQQTVQEKMTLADWLGRRMDKALRKSVERHFLDDGE